jgi:hypothetical protein
VNSHSEKRFELFSSRARNEEGSVGKLSSAVSRKATLLTLVFFLLTTITFGVLWFKEYSRRHRNEKTASEEEKARKAAYVDWKDTMIKQMKEEMAEINRRSESELEVIMEKAAQKKP